jgi:hypothetical protein
LWAKRKNKDRRHVCQASIPFGAPDFIAHIKENFISGKKLDKDLPALKELIEKPSIVDIFDAVESVIGKDAALARNVKIFLYFRITVAVLKLDLYIMPPSV